jgi:O-antigen/teichoic acid export membrane protein
MISPEIFAIMAPPEYKMGNRSVLILTAGNLFVFLYRFPLGFEQYSKNMKWVAVCTIISALANMGLNYLLINSIGFEGASIASLISYVILFGLHEIVARKIIKKYNVKFRDYINAIIISGAFFSLSYIFLDYQTIRLAIFVGLIGFTVYKVLKDYRNITFN